ncbi:MAG: CDP-glucose 4,6-dehydratase [Lachnospiraceae bacterium]|nr:CDP-glucose 4,6-dehydratase [Lachnospiraceae bacterium]
MDWKEYYKGRRVLVTGHTGFKGSWMLKLLEILGAESYGYALEPPTSPSLFDILGLGAAMGSRSRIADIRDKEQLMAFANEIQPEVVIHMAAQPIVRRGYEAPEETYSVNVMGTVNLLEMVRFERTVRSVINVTTDKVYLNTEREEPYSEEDRLCGTDPYSNSKSCSELVTFSYINSFFKDRGLPVSTMRAGNVIGGGDFAKDRLIPDCVRAVCAGTEIVLRNPDSVRPYQHVLEPVYSYLELAARQTFDPSLAGNYNIGPEKEDCLRTEDMAALFCRKWNENLKEGMHEAGYVCRSDGGPREAGLLRLDCSLIKEKLGRKPVWNSETAVAKTAEWTAAWTGGEDIREVTERQIKEFLDSI